MAEPTSTKTPSRPRTGKRGIRNVWQLLGLTALALVIALLLGWFTGVMAGKAFGPEEPPARTTETAPPSEEPTEPDASGQPISIVDATLFDPPPGDGAENPDRIDLTYDGQPGTTWPTLQYQSTALFGNIKPGVGIVYDLGEEQLVSAVEIVTTIPGADLEIRTGTGTTGTIEDFQVAAGPVTLQTNTTVELPEATTTRYVLVWITKLVPQQGYFQAALSEVTIIG